MRLGSKYQHLVHGAGCPCHTSEFAQLNERLTRGFSRRAALKTIEVVEAAREMNVLLLDISSISASDALRHSRYAAMAAIYSELDDDADWLNSIDRQSGGKFFDAGALAAAPN